MIREVEPWEYDYLLPPLSEKEAHALEQPHIEKLMDKAEELTDGPKEFGLFVQADDKESLVRRYANPYRAAIVCLMCNRRARKWGLRARYYVRRVP